MTAEDREAPVKSLRLATHIEQLYQTEEEFRRWCHKGLDDIEAGHI